MPRAIEHTGAFKRDFKREKAGKHRRKVGELVASVVDALAADRPLPQANRDHPLSGAWNDCRECHLRPDLLLVYRKPAQVIVLKSTRAIVQLQNQWPNASTDDFIDSLQTKEFPLFCAGVELASSGELVLLAEIRDNEHEAARRFQNIRAEAGNIATWVAQLTKTLNPEHLRALRKREPLSNEFQQVVTRMILRIAAYLFKGHPEVTRMPKARELRRTFLFRYSLAFFVMAKRWIAEGAGPIRRSLKHSRTMLST